MGGSTSGRVAGIDSAAVGGLVACSIAGGGAAGGGGGAIAGGGASAGGGAGTTAGASVCACAATDGIARRRAKRVADRLPFMNVAVDRCVANWFGRSLVVCRRHDD